jgi:hypothetical protein
MVVQNRANIFLSQDLARLDNFAGNQEFGDNPPSTNTFVLPLVSNVKLGELTLPTYKITIAPNGHDRWIFDCTVTIKASDGSQFSSSQQGDHPRSRQSDVQRRLHRVIVSPSRS